MKNIVLIYGIIIISKISLLWGTEEEYLARDQEPTMDELRFVYQNLALEEISQYDIKEIYTKIHEEVKVNNLLLREKITSNYSYLLNRLFFQIIKKLYSCDTIRENLLLYFDLHQIKSFTPFCETEFPINERITEDFNINTYKKLMKFFSESPDYHCSDDFDKMTTSEENNIRRIISDESSDKAILFVGFNQEIPANGSEIIYNTAKYRKSLFLNTWLNSLNENYNVIKIGHFGQILTIFPQLENYFDYVIIEGQRFKNILPEIFVKFGELLKENGRIVYQKYDDNIYYTFNNKLLKQTIPNYDFKLYICDNPENEVFKEITYLASFNNESSFGDSFCYGSAEKLCWHKKVSKQQ